MNRWDGPSARTYDNVAGGGCAAIHRWRRLISTDVAVRWPKPRVFHLLLCAASCWDRMDLATTFGCCAKHWATHIRCCFAALRFWDVGVFSNLGWSRGCGANNGHRSCSGCVQWVFSPEIAGRFVVPVCDGAFATDRLFTNKVTIQTYQMYVAVKWPRAAGETWGRNGKMVRHLSCYTVV